MKAGFFLAGYQLILVVLVSGCSYSIKPEESKLLGTKHESVKNYEIGKPQQVYVGEPIVKIKDFYVTRYSTSFMSPAESLSMKGGYVTLSLEKGKKYSVLGTIPRNGRTYTVVRVPYSVQPLGILVSNDGHIHNEVINKLGLENKFIPWNFSVNPTQAKMEYVAEERVDSKAGYTNRELIYSGTDGKTIQLAYREFTPDEVARPAFYQNLTYDINSPYIRFQKFRILINKATNESLAYTVEEDGVLQTHNSGPR